MNYRPEPPQLMPTTVADGRVPGVYYRIDGELVPVLHIWLDGSVPVFSSITSCCGRIPPSRSASGAKVRSREWSPACSCC